MKFLIDEISSVGKVHTGMPVLWKASQNIRLQLFMANSIDTVFFYLIWLSYLFSVKRIIDFSSPLFYWTFGASCLLFIIGVIMFAVKRRLEKVEDT